MQNYFTDLLLHDVSFVMAPIPIRGARNACNFEYCHVKFYH